jgi:hypothetical protein
LIANEEAWDEEAWDEEVWDEEAWNVGSPGHCQICSG